MLPLENRSDISTARALLDIPMAGWALKQILEAARGYAAADGLRLVDRRATVLIAAALNAGLVEAEPVFLNVGHSYRLASGARAVIRREIDAAERRRRAT